ncbi:MAG: riboflavin synthase [Candidatus Latescibacteria bacterium]|nr:riboflavin synthase [Candidatus Latescibacterota bacterium]
MFTGLIEEVGAVRRVQRQGAFQRLEVSARLVLEGTRLGDSININGACQTAVELGADYFAVESVEETLQRTTLGALRPGDPVNLERSVRLQDRLGGHLVLGHVDGVGRISQIETRQREWLVSVEPPAELLRYLAFKGSIAIDGISLTVAQVEGRAFTAAIIPHTFDQTTLGRRRRGDVVNLEVDVIARYVERLLRAGDPASGTGLTLEKMRDMGY